MRRRSTWCWIIPRPSCSLVLLTMGVNVYLYIKVPKGFFPQQDTGRLQGNVVGQQHISYQALVEKAKWFEEQVRTDPDVETVTMVAGTSGGGFGGNSAQYQRSAQAGGSSQVHFGPGDRPSAPQDLRRARGDHVPAELPGRAHRRPAGQRAIPIHAAGARLRVAGGMGAESSGSALDASGDCGRQLRPAEFRLVVQCGHRPRYRVAPRSHGASGGLRALRRFRPAPGLGDVQVDQSVPRGSGAAAAMVGKPGLPEDDLRADAQRHRRSSVDLHALHAGDHAHFAAAPGAVPGNHAFVQPRGGRRAERRRDRDQPGGSGDGPARQHHRQVRRHRAGLSGCA